MTDANIKKEDKNANFNAGTGVNVDPNPVKFDSKTTDAKSVKAEDKVDPKADAKLKDDHKDFKADAKLKDDHKDLKHHDEDHEESSEVEETEEEREAREEAEAEVLEKAELENLERAGALDPTAGGIKTTNKSIVATHPITHEKGSPEIQHGVVDNQAVTITPKGIIEVPAEDKSNFTEDRPDDHKNFKAKGKGKKLKDGDKLKDDSKKKGSKGLKAGEEEETPDERRAREAREQEVTFPYNQAMTPNQPNKNPLQPNVDQGAVRHDMFLDPIAPVRRQANVNPIQSGTAYDRHKVDVEPYVGTPQIVDQPNVNPNVPMKNPMQPNVDQGAVRHDMHMDPIAPIRRQANVNPHVAGSHTNQEVLDALKLKKLKESEEEQKNQHDHK